MKNMRSSDTQTTPPQPENAREPAVPGCQLVMVWSTSRSASTWTPSVGAVQLVVVLRVTAWEFGDEIFNLRRAVVARTIPSAKFVKAQRGNVSLMRT